MTDKLIEQLRKSLHDRDPACYDEESDGEPDASKTDESNVDEDATDNSDTETFKEEQEEEDNPEEKPDRRRSVIKGRNNFQWTAFPSGSQKQEFKVYVPSAMDEARDVETPLDAWSLFFTDEMLQSVVQHTNMEMQRKREYFSEQLYYKDTDLCELKAFLGLVYFGGVEKNNRRNTEELWNPFYSGFTFYKCVMSEHRFRFLLACLRFDDKTTRSQRTEQHALAPIKDLWERFIEHCKKYYSPSTNCTIDEQLLGFRGQFSARVYVAKNPDRCGIKIISCNDARTSYMINADVYVRSTATQDEPLRYVEKLTETIHNTDRTVTCDSWFTSVKLLQEMKERHSLRMIGSIRKSRADVPKSFVKSGPVGSTRYAFAPNLTLLSYCPKQTELVLLLSSIHKRVAVDKEEEPEMFTFFNETNGGTKSFYQLCKTYTTSMMTKRWTTRIFYGMLDQAGLNANILYNLRTENRPLSRRPFLQELASSLVKPHLRARLQVSNLRSGLRDAIAQMLGTEEIPVPMRSDKLPKRKRCTFCPSQRDRKTLYCCAQCHKAVCEEHRTSYCKNCAF